jgi:hypothetical protein
MLCHDGDFVPLARKNKGSRQPDNARSKESTKDVGLPNDNN